MKTSDSSLLSLKAASPSRWYDKLFAMALLLAGGWWLLDVWLIKPVPSSAVADAVKQPTVAEAAVSQMSQPGTWWFSGVEWTVSFLPLTETQWPESGVRVKPLESLLSAYSTSHAMIGETDVWRFEREHVFARLATKNRKDGTELLGLDLQWEDADGKHPMSFRPSRNGSQRPAVIHLMPLPENAEPVCLRVQPGGKLSLEVVQTHVSDDDLQKLWQAAGWKYQSQGTMAKHIRNSFNVVAEEWAQGNEAVVVVALSGGEAARPFRLLWKWTD